MMLLAKKGGNDIGLSVTRGKVGVKITVYSVEEGQNWCAEVNSLRDAHKKLAHEGVELDEINLQLLDFLFKRHQSM